MKKLLLALSCGLISLPGFAQNPISLYDGNINKNPGGNDTMYNVMLAGIPSISTGANQTWDLTGLIYKQPPYTIKYSTVSNFPDATHSSEAYYQITPSIIYKTSPMFKIDNTGQRIYGERLTQQTFSLAAQTGNPNDKVVVNAQDVIYSAPHLVMQYPCTYQYTWSSSYKAKMLLSITAQMGGLNNAPAERRSTVTTTSNIKGWGKVKVKNSFGTSSGNMEVLQVEVVATTIDSFYINGSPANPTLLALVGLSQPKVSTVYQRNFYRANEVAPVVSVSYDDANYTNIIDMNVMTQRVAWPDNIKDVYKNDGISLYPNPVVNHSVIIKTENAKAGNWSYDIISMNGQKLASASLDMNGKKAAQVELPATLTPGTYFMVLNINGEKTSVKQLTIAE